jgi:metal-dependent amidase/aminoacylase/carboxypeptidase family protein
MRHTQDKRLTDDLRGMIAPARFTYPLHHPKFAVDEDAMAIGAEILLATARALLVETDLAPPAQPTSQSSVERSV